MANIRVLICDDFPLILQGISEVLRRAVGIDVVGMANGGLLALQLVEELNPDVLLLDIQMPDITGLEVLRRLQDRELPVKILGLSSYDDPTYVRALLSSGAAGYLIKEDAVDFIVEAVRGVARGEKDWISPTMADRLDNILHPGEKLDRKMSPRELEVLRGVVDGKTNVEIGLLMTISDKTVEKHLDSVFRKLGVSSRVEAAVQAIRKDLI